MRRPRFPIRIDEAVFRQVDPLLTVSGTDSLRHLGAVLRLKPGDEIELFDQHNGCCVLGRIAQISSNEAVVHVISKLIAVEALPLTLCCGLPKPAVSDIIVEKCTEFGIQALLFFEAHRTQRRLNERERETRLNRWGKIGIEALKQSGGAQTPLINLFPSLAEALFSFPAPLPSGFRCVTISPPPVSAQPTMQFLPIPLLNLLEHPTRDADFTFIIGPEGGLTSEEISQCVSQSFRPASLGPKTLRTDTAAVAVCACVRLVREATWEKSV